MRRLKLRRDSTKTGRRSKIFQEKLQTNKKQTEQQRITRPKLTKPQQIISPKEENYFIDPDAKKILSRLK